MKKTVKKVVKAAVKDAQVTVLRFGGRPQHVTVDEDTTLEAAIDEAGFTVKPNDEVTVNSETVEKDELDSTYLSDGDRVVITPRFEGGVK